jgi:hypothetical protein
MNWSWISFAAGAFVWAVLTSIYRTFRNERENKRQAKLNDAGVSCHHGVKKWRPCKDCAEEFAYHMKCEKCHITYDNRQPHSCPIFVSPYGGHSGYSGYSGFYGR